MNNPKIGLVSFHRDPNYGTMFQAYALAKSIEKLGYEAEYINYEAITHRSWLKENGIPVIKNFLTVIGLYHAPKTEYSYLRTKEFKKLRCKYAAFHKRYIPANPCLFYADTINETEKQYCSFIVGSDQTWSSFCNTNPKTINYLSFVKDFKKKRAYAPSLGSTHITEEYRAQLQYKLSTFEYLSCRERANCDMIAKLVGKPVQFVLDPTLLLTSKEWDAIAQPAELPERYVLCYILGTKKCVSDFAENLGTIKGLPVFYMVTRPEYINKQNVLKDVSPEEFLSLFRGATYIVTDSFHGAMFSINYNRNFFSFSKRKTTDSTGIDNDRVMDFLSVVHIENRFVDDGDMNICGDIDYDAVNEILNRYRQTSWEYLSEIIK